MICRIANVGLELVVHRLRRVHPTPESVIVVASIKQAAGVGAKLSPTAVVGFARPHLSQLLVLTEGLRSHIVIWSGRNDGRLSQARYFQQT